MVAPAVQLGIRRPERWGCEVSTQKTLEAFLKEQLQHAVELSILEAKPDFRLAELTLHLLEAVLYGGSPKGTIQAFRAAILEEFPDWDDAIRVNGISMDDAQRHTQLDYLIETNQNAVALLTDKKQ
jgi:hypothetical protein